VNPILPIVAAGALLALALSSGGSPGGREPAPPAWWFSRAIKHVSGQEGTFWSQNRNTDGNGLSFGILSWTQSSGSLGKLLAAMHRAQPARFREAFGANAAELLTTTSASSSSARLRPVAGAALWGPPWSARFDAAGRDPALQAVQLHVAATSEYAIGAERAAAVLGLERSQRAMVFLFDRAVHQGPAAVVPVAESFAGWRGKTSEAALLDAVADRLAMRYRRLEAPAQVCRNGDCTQRWERVGHRLYLGNPPTWPVLKSAADEWHLMAGPYDLADLVIRRSASALRAGG
jgi:hypothetical protein